ncbi:endolytic transglycosylase MltG [Clostridium sp. Cult3]|uniref:endolytic transglycosylase MltG n=1 Tax=Clostridium sp. Cult3 TaxID=2079004 RepID=UPI001F01EA7C
MTETTNAKNKKNNKPVKKIFLLILLIVVLFFGKNYYDKGFTAIDSENLKEIDVEIPLGSNPSNIASILKEKGLIRNEIPFKIAIRNRAAGEKLKAGKYILNTGMDIYDIIDELTKGGVNEKVISFTIPEGYEIRQMAEKLAKEGIVEKERFLELTSDKKYFEDKHPILKELEEGQGLEGVLFPSTYEIYIGASEEDIIDKMISKFEEVFEGDVKPNMDKYDLNFNEAITLASIIEREAKRDDERELISAVFHNRLKEGMYLQSCATVQYALGERKEALSEQDTRIQSDYNTYIHGGLPPAPIASPGKKSLIAAVSPASVDYLYFRTKEDGTGAHTFSRTYDEHLKANPNK